ncbi:acylphosphatase [Sphingomonas profundi]|uniref:acylphosphatase n=1 Tax=Alterirhizorhabdus profundi TaxID=2681549 RepID=UPI0012E72092|nr:acylphosphatase [Sphingomonas profundi]
MAAIRLVVRGRVQGVFFRDWTVRAARSAGIAGWVRNRFDGAVEIHAEGDAAALDDFAAACRHGPERARVDALEANDATVTGAQIFERRPDA